MSDWLHNLPLVWMGLVVFGFTFLVAAAIYALVMILAPGHARSFKAVSPGMLPPLGIIFGLFVGFTAAQVWSDSAQAHAAVDREASALRSAVLLAAIFPGETETRLRALVASYIAEAAAQEWPLMAHRAITLTPTPHKRCKSRSPSIQQATASRPRSATSPPRSRAQWTRAGSASPSANRKSIG